MFKIIKKIKLFKEYKKFIKTNSEKISNEFALEHNMIYELYTTIILVDAPDEMKKKLGVITLAEHEIKNYIKKLNIYFEQNDMNELINVYEIKKISNELYGITFGFSQFNNRKYFLYKLGILSTIILALIITIKII